MRKATFAAVVATVAVGALALAGAGSAAHVKSGGPATLRAANAYVGANVVRQVGLRNYAGPNCPGRGWNCTTATRVLQVATAGGTNVGVCTGSSVSAAPNQNCTITQTGASNTARCTEQTSASDVLQAQSCTITQTGAANYAYVNQNINQSAGSNQLGTQTATVTQSGATVTNYLQLSQAANQSSKTGSTQNQQADQSATVDQTATGAGTNSSALNQTQLQKAYAQDTLQTQDTTTSALPDCNPYTVENPQPGPDHPNACAVVLQDSAAGKNTNQLRQNISEDENSTVAAVQTQGRFDGGLDGRVHQETVSGTSLNSVNQSKLQTQTAPKGAASSQTQHDPISCCGFASQVGGTGDKETINQSSALSASGDPDPSQFSSLIGTSHTPIGTCTITQKGSVNGASTTNSDTLTPTCPFLTLETTCSTNNDADVIGGGSCTASAPDTTNPFPPLSSVTLGVLNVTNAESTFSSSTDAVAGDTLEYQVVYANSGSGAAHNVSFATAVPTGTTISFADGNLTCPQTASIVGTTMNCIFGPTVDPGTVAPDTLLVFRVATFTVQVVPGAPGCGTLTDTVGIHTDEEGTVNSNPATVNLTPCIG